MRRMKTWLGWCIVAPDGCSRGWVDADRGIYHLGNGRLAHVRVTEVVKPKRRKPR